MGRHCKKQITLKNLQFFSSQRLKEDSTDITEDRQESWSLILFVLRAAQVWESTCWWTMDQLCRRAHLASDNWFRNILCTHNIFSHRFVLISSVLSNTFLRTVFCRTLCFSPSQPEKIKGNLIPTWSIIFSNGNIPTLKIKGSYYPAFEKNSIQKGTPCYRGFRPQEDELFETRNTLLWCWGSLCFFAVYSISLFLFN